MKIVKLAIEPNSGKFWTIGKERNNFHRLDGPAVIWFDSGDVYYARDGICAEFEEFFKEPKAK